MSPIDKAYELMHEFRRIEEDGKRVIMKLEHSKQCAMICVRELLKNDYNERSFVYEDKEGIHYTLYSVYWADVLIEISKL